MPDSASERTPHEQQLDALIAEYLQATDEGRPLDKAKFLSLHPEFAAELREFFADDVQIKKFAPPPTPNPEETLSFPGSSSTPRRPGTKVPYFGDYEILEELGVGGMGVVYKARQTKLNKIIALKMIKVGHLAGDDEVRQFQAEARAAAKLDHPGIVPVHEVGVDHGQHYYTMDYVGGGSLSKLHREEPVAARRAAEIIKQMAEAMHYAHGQGIVHRDLKPANVLLTAGGAPRITDFGLAKRLWHGDDSADVAMTQTGAVMGTAGYMSPEQAAGKTKLVGPPADIYALGAVLYALLTSRAPFMGESHADTILQVIQKEPVSPRVLNPSIARDLETICLKCLEKEPHKRYGTAQLLADDLSRFIENKPVLARPVSGLERTWRWCRRNPWIAGLGATVAASLLIGTIISSTLAVIAYKNHAESDRRGNALAKALGTVETKLEENKKLTEDRTNALEEARWQVYRLRLMRMEQMWREKDWGHLERMLAEGVPAAGEKDLRGWEWYYLQAQLARRAWRLHENPEKVVAIDWDRHTGKLAVFRAGTIEIWLPRERRLLKSIRVPLAPYADGLGILRWSPDQRHLAVGVEGVKVYVVDTETEQIVCPIPHELPPDKNWITYVDWSPRGDCVAVTVNDRDVHLWKVAPKPIRINSFESHEGVSHARIHWSLDLATCVTTSLDGWVTHWNTADWSQLRKTRFVDGWYPIVEWSPDGTRVAFAPTAVVVTSADGTETKRLAYQGAWISTVRWLDNERLVTANEAQEIRIVHVDQQIPDEIFRLHPQTIHVLSIGPDAQIASVALGESVKVWSPTEVAPEHITLAGATLPSKVAACTWHPQSNVLGLVSPQQGSNVAATWSPGASQVENLPLTNGASSVHWDPTGDALVVETTDGTWKALPWPPPANPEPAVKSQRWGQSYSFEGRFRVDAQFFSQQIAVVDTHEKAATVHPKLDTLYAFAWHPREFCLAIAQVNHINLCYPLRDESAWVATPFNEQLPEARCLAWSRNSKQLLVGSNSGVIHVRDGATLEIVHTLRGHARAITAIVGSHDGARIVSSGVDGFLRWWMPPGA